MRIRKASLVAKIAEMSEGELFVKLKTRVVIGLSKSGGSIRCTVYSVGMEKPVYRLSYYDSIEGLSMTQVLRFIEEEGYRPFTVVSDG